MYILLLYTVVVHVCMYETSFFIFLNTTVRSGYIVVHCCCIGIQIIWKPNKQEQPKRNSSNERIISYIQQYIHGLIYSAYTDRQSKILAVCLYTAVSTNGPVQQQQRIPPVLCRCTHMCAQMCMIPHIYQFGAVGADCEIPETEYCCCTSPTAAVLMWYIGLSIIDYNNG